MMRTDSPAPFLGVGITGGVGAGKSRVLSLLKEHTSCRVILADTLAKELEQPGERCYEPIVSLLGKEILHPDQTIDPRAMASLIYGDERLRQKINAIIHPAVKEEICAILRMERERGQIRFLFVEAALLIENGFDKILDEIWYIYAREEIRRERLRLSLGYSEEKISAIMAAQLSDEEFRRACPVVIDNSGSVEDTEKQIVEILKKRGGE